jgi:protein involved in polysaccharide export with SLBB domain
VPAVMGDSLRVGLLGLVALAGGGGCATCPAKVSAALRTPPAGRHEAVVRQYTVSCPDVLRVQAPGHPPLVLTVEPDGCITVPAVGRIRVDGSTPADIATLLSRAAGRPGTDFAVDVVEHASRHILIFGPGEGVQHMAAYVGPESVTDFLRRNGGLPVGAAFHTVHVVRPHVANGQRPELYAVDLEAILMKNNPETDVILRPYDQVYIGQTKGASLARHMPPWVRKLFPDMSALDEAPEKPKE